MVYKKVYLYYNKMILAYCKMIKIDDKIGLNYADF